MNPLLRLMLAFGFLSLAHGTAMAQTQPPACPLVEKPSLYVLMVAPRSGCPLSAVIQITRTQTLADGTHIQQSAKELVYRDSLGRIRHESYARGDTVPRVVIISDPVGGFVYMLQPQKSTVASRHKLGQSTGNAKLATQDQRTRTPGPKVATEALGEQEFEGVLATGTRTTRTTPAGAEGNDRALTTIKETWSSKDIGITFWRKPPTSKTATPKGE